MIGEEKSALVTASFVCLGGPHDSDCSLQLINVKGRQLCLLCLSYLCYLIWMVTILELQKL